MYKRTLLSLLLAVYCLILPNAVHAQSVTPEDKTNQIRDQLITNIASRVAQLKLVEKRGIIGVVTNATNTQITVNDSQNNTRFIDVDELTKFSNPDSEGSFGISDITSGTTIGILGLYNKESRRILARFVTVTTNPVIIHGGVTAVDNNDYAISVATEDGKQMTVDVENLTKTYSFTQETDYIKSGFSKIKENYNIIAIGALDKKNKDTLIATRIIFFPEIPSSPKINSALENVQKSK
jgi:hypothetical protein